MLGSGKDLGLQFSYVEQARPEGLAQAFLLKPDFIAGEKVCLILGDNLFYGHHLPVHLKEAKDFGTGGVVFGYPVRDPERYGVVEFDEQNKVIGIEEKPARPKSNYAVPGLYFYDEKVVDFASSLKPSARGELEITDLNRLYLDRGELKVNLLGRGVAWLDTGTPASLHQAAQFVETLQERQGLKISCIEEIVYHLGYIGKEELLQLAQKYGQSEYGHYLKHIAELPRSVL